MLKINDKPIICEYFNTITSHGFFPKITLPSRFSEYHGTLIDNLLCNLSEGFFKSSAGILISNISGHFPYFLCLDYVQTANTIPTFIQIKHNPDSLNKFKMDTINSNIYDKLNKDNSADPNENYYLLEEIVTIAMDKFMAIKLIKFNKCKHKKTPWITQDIIMSIKFRKLINCTQE